ncbi:MAG: repeat-containing protein [Candidatus Hydrogenedentes bacterium]|nr:repeat-containing protein [Candidatus Hydrogenedentota bacterium]
MSMPLLVSIGLLLAAEPAHYVLNEDVSIWDVAAVDVNGDGLADVFALCCDEKSDPLRKYVAVHLAEASGAYPAKPSCILKLDPSVGGAFFAETDGAAPKELVAANAEGATVYAFRNGAFETAGQSAFTSLFPSGSQEPLFLKKTAVDLDGDGIDEWLIPAASSYEVRNLGGLVARAGCDVVSEIHGENNLYIAHRLPAYHTFTLEGEAQKGLAFLSDEFADFAHGPGWAEHKRFRIPVDLDEKWEASSKMDDIDGNGFPDLVVNQTRGTVNLQVLTQVYLSSAPFTYPETPTARYEAKGAVTSPELVDVNGDKMLDLMFVRIPFGVTTIVNYFVRGKLTVHVDVHVFDGKTFPEEPTFHTKLSLDAPEGRERVAYTTGDYNGDGRLDVAFGAGADEIDVLTGSPERFISSRPWVTIELPAFGDARTYDLNANKQDDIVLYHPTGDNRKRIEVIVF